MALITRVRPQAGDTAIRDLVSSTDFTGSGSISLVDVGAEKAWNITALSSYTLPTAIKNIEGSVDGAGATIAARFRQNTAGTNSFMPFVGIGSTSAGMRLMRAGTNFRGRIKDSQAEANTSGVTILGEIVTIVYKIRTSTSTTDSGALWVGGLARTGNDPNFVSTGVNLAASNNIQNAFINVTDSADYDLLDFVYYDEELPDADCASMADDIVAFFGGGGASNITISETLPALSSSMSMTFTGVAGTSNITISDTLPSLSSAMSMTYAASGVGTITISDWANNTGTALPSVTGITVNVRSLVDGSTVYRTTSASTDASVDCVISDAAIVAGTSYEVTALKFNGVDYDIGIAIITAT